MQQTPHAIVSFRNLAFLGQRYHRFWIRKVIIVQRKIRLQLVFLVLSKPILMGKINSFLSLLKSYDLDNQAPISYLQLQNGTIALKIR
jgi:hypothetical protein